MSDYTMIELPGYALRALHSAWTDWLADAPGPVRDSMIERCEGITFERFALALMRQALVVVNRLNEDTGDLSLGIAVPVKDSMPWELVWLPSSHTGIDVSTVIGLAIHDLDGQLSQLLESE